MLGELYRSQYEQQFENHPKKEEIVQALIDGGNSIAQIELWFAEACHYTWEKIRNTPRQKPNADGTITFHYYKGNNNGKNRT